MRQIWQNEVWETKIELHLVRLLTAGVQYTVENFSYPAFRMLGQGHYDAELLRQRWNKMWKLVGTRQRENYIIKTELGPFSSYILYLLLSSWGTGSSATCVICNQWAVSHCYTSIVLSSKNSTLIKKLCIFQQIFLLLICRKLAHYWWTVLLVWYLPQMSSCLLQH